MVVDGYIIVKFIQLIYVFVCDFSVWQHFNVLRGAEDVAPYNAR